MAEGIAPSHRRPKTFKARILSLFLLWRLQQPRHGYLLVRDVQSLVVTPVRSSTVYAILARLERIGYIKASYDRKSAHVRKLYRTTASGAALLQKVREKHSNSLLREFMRDLVG
ncbi:Transcriptional regulator PadR-like family protein [uncultured archaeon]|nr:Transcriptional regulator PadR-like family protein [uncultured archaeon]